MCADKGNEMNDTLSTTIEIPTELLKRVVNFIDKLGPAPGSIGIQLFYELLPFLAFIPENLTNTELLNTLRAGVRVSGSLENMGMYFTALHIIERRLNGESK